MDNLQECEKQSKTVVVVVPFPAQGHLNMLLHLSYILSSYNIPINFISTTAHVRQAKLRTQGWDPLSTSQIHFHESDIPLFDSPPPDPNAPTKFPTHLLPSFEASSYLCQPIFNLISTLSKSAEKVVVIFDSLMGMVIQDVASIPNVEAYMFVVCSAFNVFWTMWEGMGKPDLDFDHNEVSKVVPSQDGCYSQEAMEFLQTRDASSLPPNFHSGTIYDTCKVIEGDYLDLIGKLELGIGMSKSKLWALGPFNPVKVTTNNPHKCLEWLDKQEPKSVIYVSFGTTTSLSTEQIYEIAKGLEASEVKFIWVLRDADRGNIFKGEEGRSVDLPEGFEERIKGKGIVEREWVPQLNILGHPSTGGFMSHCGWNSCMECVTMGVPIAAWPMHSDQPRNAVLLTKVLKAGILIREWEDRDKLVTSRTIENVVRRLINLDDGEAIRMRAAEIGDAVRQSMAEGGASRVELDSFVSHIMN